MRMTITLKQLKPLACHTRAHCATCRTDADWRERVTGVRDFTCPHKVTANNLPEGPAPIGYGTKLERILKTKYNVKSCSACFEQIAEMNAMSYDEAVAAKPGILESIWSRRDQTRGLRKIALALPGAKHLALRELGKLYDEALA